MQETANPKWKEEYEEGELAKKIEGQTAKLPSDIFLWRNLKHRLHYE